MSLKIYRPHPTFKEAIRFGRGLCAESTGEITNPEYVRGVTEFIIDLFAVEDGMDSRDDIELMLTHA